MRLKILNEKFLVFCLFALSIGTMMIIMMNLPNEIQSVVSEDKLIKKVFIPQHGGDNLIHAENHQHEAPPILPDDRILPKDDVKDDKNSVDFEIPDVIGKNSVEELTLTIKEKLDKIKNMALFGWHMYEKYAWGDNELKPVSMTGHSAGIFGSSTKFGATIVDGLDTMYIMGFKEEYLRGKKWIEQNFHLNVNSEISVFEINIRFIGGFLSLYTLTKEKIFLDKAEEVAKILLPAFDTQTGIPFAIINPLTKKTKNYNWASGGCSILAEFGTLSLEFEYLSDLTGNPVFSEKIKKIEKVLADIEKKDGLYFNYLHPNTGKWCVKHATIGALADSFYEYLIKIWVYKGKSDQKALTTYLAAMDALRNKLVQKSETNLYYFANIENDKIVKKMDHLACFSGGLLAFTSNTVEMKQADQKVYLDLAKNITHTCHESYIRTNTHLGPESFRFERNDMEAMALRSQDKYYILRPEVIEAYFYLWRITKEEKYRDWAWDAAMAIEKHCRTEHGYSGVADVYASDDAVKHDDVQQSFFFAETLKYLFLIFSDDDVLPLDKYVFNTEAHPFLIKTDSLKAVNSHAK